MKIRILLADDHPFMVQGLHRLLEDRFEVAGAADNGQALLELALRLRPDVAITDISMPIMNGFEVARRLRLARSSVKIVFLTMHSDADLVAEAFRAGASGYVLKSSAVEELATAIQSASEGRIFLTGSLANGWLESINTAATAGTAGKVFPGTGSGDLTPRERQVLQLVAEGRIMKEIAAILDVSVSTVGYHRYNIMDKLHLRSTAELTQYAIRRKVVVPISGHNQLFARDAK